MNIFETTKDSFNARYLTTEQIAKTFIVNKQYLKLLKNNHSLLMGPRGCGKTTLLKMLTIKAINYWEHDVADKLKANLPFWSIYIPADTQWKCELEKLKFTFTGSEHYYELLSRELVNINIETALIDTFEQIIDYYVHEEKKRNLIENIISKKLMNLWLIIKPLPPTFSSLREYVLGRVNDINYIVSEMFFLKKSIREIKLPQYFMKLEYFSLILQSCNVFENSIKNELFYNEDIRWALCFDELEIAPEWLQFSLMQKLRSTDQKYYFKLTTSPLISLYDEIKQQNLIVSANENDDYDIIRNWVYNKDSKEEWNKFCDTLVRARILRKYGLELTPQEIFGKHSLEYGLFEAEKNKFGSSINKENNEEGSVIYILLKEMAQLDPSIYRYLTRKNINPLHPIVTDDKKKDEVLRKIKPLIIYRYYFNKNKNDRISKRSRKIVKLHFGVSYIYEICDGNPRSLIKLIDLLLQNFEYKKDKAIPIGEQAEKIAQYSESMLLRISNHPDATIRLGKSEWNLGEIINTIGKYFQDRINIATFSADPCSSFRIPENTPPQILKLLRLALDLGTIQYLDPKSEYFHDKMKRKRFRLSYVLYPNFNLPQQDFGAIELNKILVPKKTITINEQISFLENENEN